MKDNRKNQYYKTQLLCLSAKTKCVLIWQSTTQGPPPPHGEADASFLRPISPVSWLAWNCCLEDLGTPLVKSETGPHTERGRKDWRKKQSTLDWWVANLVSENVLTKLVLGSHDTGRSPHLPARILKVCM